MRSSCDPVSVAVLCSIDASLIQVTRVGHGVCVRYDQACIRIIDVLSTERRFILARSRELLSLPEDDSDEKHVLSHSLFFSALNT